MDAQIYWLCGSVLFGFICGAAWVVYVYSLGKPAEPYYILRSKGLDHLSHCLNVISDSDGKHESVAHWQAVNSIREIIGQLEHLK